MVQAIWSSIHSRALRIDAYRTPSKESYICYMLDVSHPMVHTGVRPDYHAATCLVWYIHTLSNVFSRTGIEQENIDSWPSIHWQVGLPKSTIGHKKTIRWWQEELWAHQPDLFRGICLVTQSRSQEAIPSRQQKQTTALSIKQVPGRDNATSSEFSRSSCTIFWYECFYIVCTNQPH